MRQDCPLSLLFFSIVVDLFTTAIWKETEIQEKQIGKTPNLFADNMILYKSDSQGSNKKKKT